MEKGKIREYRKLHRSWLEPNWRGEGQGALTNKTGLSLKMLRLSRCLQTKEEKQCWQVKGVRPRDRQACGYASPSPASPGFGAIGCEMVRSHGRASPVTLRIPSL